MNRIIVIGNGFDLSHGFRTSYANFIQDFWQKKLELIRTKNIGEMYNDDDIEITRIPSKWINNGENYPFIMKSIQDESGSLRFKNSFLQKITVINSNINWVDIENVYYQRLKHEAPIDRQQKSISKLNIEFLSIQNKLVEYLKEISEKEIITASRREPLLHQLFSPFHMKEFTEAALGITLQNETFRLEPLVRALREKDFLPSNMDRKTVELVHYLRPYLDLKDVIRKILLSNQANHYFNLFPKEILILNFNYTSTETKYLEYAKEELFKRYGIQTSVIHIHGELDTKNDNPIIFGFGDELDEDYKKIENLNKNECLEFVKSIRYLNNGNYKRTLEFMNADHYQVSIFGHSCGLSDRTLLNTLFEHNNCVSIMPYYYQDGEVDNYSDIVKNISRCFNNKALMRDKVVNKEYCESF